VVSKRKLPHEFCEKIAIFDRDLFDVILDRKYRRTQIRSPNPWLATAYRDQSAVVPVRILAICTNQRLGFVSTPVNRLPVRNIHHGLMKHEQASGVKSSSRGSIVILGRFYLFLSA